MRNFINNFEYDQYRKRLTRTYSIISSILILLAFIIFLVFWSKKGSTFYHPLESIPLWIYLFIVGLFMDKNTKSLTAKNDKFFRIRTYPLCIFILVWTIIATIANIGFFAKIIAMGQFDSLNNSESILLIIYFCIVLIAFCIVIVYAIQWLTTYRWEYNELKLNRSEKSNILKQEKIEYKEFKSENKKIDKEQNAIKRNERKDAIKNAFENIEKNLSKKTDYIKEKIKEKQKNNTPVTKYDKLQELNDLYKNGIISKSELEKARENILGK